MIRWCSYCQKYVGEVPPLQDYSMTHTICDECTVSVDAREDANIQAMRQIASFYQRLQDASDAGDTLRASALVDEGLGLGLRIGDLAWGMLQPLLYRLGERWAAGELSVANDHAFSAMAMSAVELLFAKDARLQSRRQHHAPEILLVMAEENYHTLGLCMAELGLCLQGHTTMAVMPGLPAKEIAALVRSLKPKVLGMSVALAPQMSSVREVHGMLQGMQREDRPRLAIGGSALRLGLEVPDEWGIQVVTDLTRPIVSRP